MKVNDSWYQLARWSKLSKCRLIFINHDKLSKCCPSYTIKYTRNAHNEPFQSPCTVINMIMLWITALAHQQQHEKWNSFTSTEVYYANKTSHSKFFMLNANTSFDRVSSRCRAVSSASVTEDSYRLQTCIVFVFVTVIVFVTCIWR